jgi:Fe-Mn family superoxide dismutase
LLDAIETNFESLPAFKLAFASAYGMSGSGYVWLAQDKDKNLGIVPTYGAGTLLVQNRIQRDGARMEWTQASISEKGTTSPASSSPSPLSPSARLQQSGSRAMSTSAATQFSSPNSLPRGPSSRNLEGAESRGEELYPLLCVSVHERDWLPDYGMWGKEEYLMRFWECVDWARVFRLWETYHAST